MPTCPVIDTHLHLWDPRLMRYPWLDGHALLNRPYRLEDYNAATESVPIEAMVFVQAEADPSEFEREADWVSSLAKCDPRLRGLVAWAPLEKGRAVSADLERLKRHDILCGIRRIIQFESDLDFCLRPDFIDGVRALKDFDLTFDLCVDHRHLGNILRLVERVPDVSFILDHVGKPDIHAGRWSPWSEQMRALARHSNVVCKISGVATEADHRSWTPTQLKPYIDVAIEAFGFERLLYGGDWPVSTQAIQYVQWVTLLDDLLAGVGANDQCKFWHDNAIRIYRLDGATQHLQGANQLP